MYTSFYKLRAEPFLLTPDERFYFESSVHSQAMAHLTYGLKRGEGFIVITGDVGRGQDHAGQAPDRHHRSQQDRRRPCRDHHAVRP